MRTAIIGAGLFGSIIAAALRARGEDVKVFDRGEREAGSGPAACLMKPSWLSSLSAEQLRVSLGLLDELYGLHTLNFKVGPVLAPVHWVSPRKVLRPPDYPLSVANILRAERQWELRFTSHWEDPQFYDRVVVAAGVWTPDLVSVPVTRQLGVAFTWQGTTSNEISVWAPYRQLVRFERRPGEVWAGDGSTWRVAQEDKIRAAEQRCRQFVGREEAPQEDKIRAAEQRCRQFVGREEAPVRHYGWRPKCDLPAGQPCHLSLPGENLWVATGGAKNGTIAAAWCAAVITGRIKQCL